MEQAIRDVLKKHVELGDISERDEYILLHRYELDSYLTYEQMGRKLHVSPERVRVLYVTSDLIMRHVSQEYRHLMRKWVLDHLEQLFKHEKNLDRWEWYWYV